jgi:hypothetical protein
MGIAASSSSSVFAKGWTKSLQGIVDNADLRIKPGPQFRMALSLLSLSHSRRNCLLLR